MAHNKSDNFHANLIQLIREKTGDRFPDTQDSLSDLLKNYIYRDFSERESLLHWQNILIHHAELRAKLGPSTDIQLAIMDYFINITHMVSSPLLIETHTFRHTEQLAMIDPLTGLFNRRYMDIALKKEFNRCSRYDKNLSVFLLDIDDFKKINDTRGHPFGDRVIRELADMLTDMVREEDIACRYGGEEFLLILPETDVEGANILTDRLKKEIKSRPFFIENGITFSGGYATYPDTASSADNLIEGADRALYQAKSAGKDRIFAANPDRRKFSRFDQRLNLDIFRTRSGVSVTGIQTQNVSCGGVRFACGVRYRVNTPLDLVLAHINSGVDNMEARGKISWMRETPGSYLYGVRFLETPEFLESCLCANGNHI